MNDHLPEDRKQLDDEALAPVAAPEPESEAKPEFPDRRSIFRMLGVALVWYYVYQLVRPLVLGEVDANERWLIILFAVLMTGANLWLTIKIGREQWKAYKVYRDKKDTRGT